MESKEIEIYQKANELFGSIQAYVGFLGCFILSIFYVLIDLWINDYSNKPTIVSHPFFNSLFISLMNLAIAIIPSMVAVSFLAILTWLFIGQRLLKKDIDPSAKELEHTAMAIKRTNAKPIETNIFRAQLREALKKNKKSKHVAVLTAEAVKYYNSGEVIDVYNGISHESRERIIVLLNDKDHDETYTKLYHENLPSILKRFENSGDIFLVQWGDLFANNRYHPCIRDCAVFPSESQHTVFTNFIGESFLRMTKSPFEAYQFNDRTLGDRILTSFQAIKEDSNLKIKSDFVKKKYINRQ